MIDSDHGPLSRAPRRHFLTSVLAATVFALGMLGCGSSDYEAPKPYASWTAALSDQNQTLPTLQIVPPPTFNNQTVRHVLQLSLAGDSLRIKLSNLFGTAPVTFSGVHVALSAGQSGIVAGSDHVVSFSGQAALTLPVGAEAFSDTVALRVGALQSIAVSMYFANPTPMPTVHALARQTTYLGDGNQLAAATLPAADATFESYYGLTAVETNSIQAAKVLVAFGDSITDGYNATVDANLRYPNQLDARLKAAGQARVSVVNEAISGNRWLHDFFGPAGSGRFERDVLGVTGVSHVIILLGINDIGFSVAFAPDQEVSAAQIIAAMDSAVDKANARGIKVFLGTLLPFKGAQYYSDAGEVKRQAVNAYIRSNTKVAGVIDFDAAMRDAADPLLLNAAYDSGDHLHPNDAGYGVMAASVDLSKLP